MNVSNGVLLILDIAICLVDGRFRRIQLLVCRVVHRQRFVVFLLVFQFGLQILQGFIRLFELVAHISSHKSDQHITLFNDIALFYHDLIYFTSFLGTDALAVYCRDRSRARHANKDVSFGHGSGIQRGRIDLLILIRPQYIGEYAGNSNDSDA
ncbi:hypothetical protein D3C75_807990 [compost metagenome]